MLTCRDYHPRPSDRFSSSASRPLHWHRRYQFTGSRSLVISGRYSVNMGVYTSNKQGHFINTSTLEEILPSKACSRMIWITLDYTSVFIKTWYTNREHNHRSMYKSYGVYEWALTVYFLAVNAINPWTVLSFYSCLLPLYIWWWVLFRIN